jgi:hypothetical protein
MKCIPVPPRPLSSARTKAIPVVSNISFFSLKFEFDSSLKKLSQRFYKYIFDLSAHQPSLANKRRHEKEVAVPISIVERGLSKEGLR